MKLYHGTDNPDFKLQPIKEGVGYHPGAGPVEFLGPSFSDNEEVAGSYGKIIIQKDIKINIPSATIDSYIGPVTTRSRAGY